MGLALVLLASNGAAKPAVATTVLMAQILRAASAVVDYHRATANIRQAQALDQQLGQLCVVVLPVAAQTVAGSTRGPGLQLPTPLEARPHTDTQRINPNTQRGGRDAGR